jgi:IclR family pca regulon transcriptional regulator
MSSRLPEGMGGLAKGLAILEIFSPKRSRLTISEAAEACGTSRASARRCLLTLAELGYLNFDGKFFRPQARLIALSAGYSGTRSLPQMAQPYLASARDKLNESISLAVLDGRSGLFVARAEAERLVATGIQIGTRMDLYCSATGRVLLAGWTDERVDDYLANTDFKARTRNSLVKKAALREAVRQTRTEGYGSTDQELEIGLRSVAVPVFDGNGSVVAAMSASASSARVTVAQMVRGFVPVLRKHADELSRIL